MLSATPSPLLLQLTHLLLPALTLEMEYSAHPLMPLQAAASGEVRTQLRTSVLKSRTYICVWVLTLNLNTILDRYAITVTLRRAALVRRAPLDCLALRKIEVKGGQQGVAGHGVCMRPLYRSRTRKLTMRNVTSILLLERAPESLWMRMSILMSRLSVLSVMRVLAPNRGQMIQNPWSLGISRCGRIIAFVILRETTTRMQM